MEATATSKLNNSFKRKKIRHFGSKAKCTATADTSVYAVDLALPEISSLLALHVIKLRSHLPSRLQLNVKGERPESVTRMNKFQATKQTRATVCSHRVARDAFARKLLQLAD